MFWQKMHQPKALILIDLQNDFCPGGALAVPEGNHVIPLANALQPFFDYVIATQDWHPDDHMSFADNHPNKAVGETITWRNHPQLLWPKHCIQESQGAQFHPHLSLEKIHKIFRKGTNKAIDSYSAFFDNLYLQSTGLSEYLIEHHIKDIYLLGLATDYCVKYSALDGIKAGFNVYLIADACRGVNLKPEDSEIAIQEMQSAGVVIVHAKELLGD